VHAHCGERLRQRYVCPAHGEVERDDMVKGFAIATYAARGKSTS
jgi:non-homologous end joining protein Ku